MNVDIKKVAEAARESILLKLRKVREQLIIEGDE